MDYHLRLQGFWYDSMFGFVIKIKVGANSKAI